MGEGNSWPRANNVIVITFDWALDLWLQCIDRCYRLNSVKDVNIWPIICSGTMDPKLEAMIDDKADAAELVIDGKLLGEDVKEVSLAELLRVAIAEFENAEKYPEEKLELEWPELRENLATAWVDCRASFKHQPIHQPQPRLGQHELPTLMLHLASAIRG